jgi:hypothetical protein
MPAVNGVPCNNYSHLAGAQAGTILKPAPGLLHTLTVNTPVAGTVTLFDGAVAIAIVTVPAALNPFELTFDVAFNTNLNVTITGAQDITVTWQ